MSEIVQQALAYLESGSINWTTAIKLYLALPEGAQHDAIKDQLIRRAASIKPSLIELLENKLPELAEKYKNHPAITEINDRRLIIDLEVKDSLFKKYDAFIIDSTHKYQLFVKQLFTDPLNIDPIEPDALTMGYGSCFAVNFITHIQEKQFNAFASVISEDVNHPANNFDLLNYGANGKKSGFVEKFLSGKNEAGILELITKIHQCSHLVYTLGSAIYLVDKDQERIYKPSKSSRQKISDVSEIVSYLRKTIDLLKTINPDINIILTVSPIPIKGVIGAHSPITANSESKSILRSAISQSLEGFDKVQYLPSYEAFIASAPYCHSAYFGGDDGNVRHLNGPILNSALSVIFDYLCQPKQT